MDEQSQFRLETYRQFWEQSRHNRALLGTFTSFYAVIVGGAIVFLGRPSATSNEMAQGVNVSSQSQFLFVFLFLSVVSLFGLLAAWHTRYSTHQYRDHRRIMMLLMTGGDFFKLEEEEKKELRHPWASSHSRWSLIPWDDLYPWAYAVAVLVFSLLAAGVIPYPGYEGLVLWAKWIVAAVGSIIFLAFLVGYLYTWAVNRATGHTMPPPTGKETSAAARWYRNS
ncbi:MAG: hypothetical protein HYY00_07565 [Chloroflexi bacterium]|nr:hypothetical protein [Chloroflexota bacterium]